MGFSLKKKIVDRDYAFLVQGLNVVADVEYINFKDTDDLLEKIKSILFFYFSVYISILLINEIWIILYFKGYFLFINFLLEISGLITSELNRREFNENFLESRQCYW